MSTREELITRYLDRAAKDIGSEVRDVVREWLGDPDDHGDDVEPPLAGEDVRELFQAWHAGSVDAYYGPDPSRPSHDVGSYRLCSNQLCRRSAELLGDR